MPVFFVVNVVALFALVGIFIASRRLARRSRTTRLPSLKPPWLYWFWRIYAPLVYVGFLLAAASAIFRQDEPMFLWFYFGFALFAAATIAILTCCAFPFAYSAFGNRRRTPLPDEPALRTFANSYGIIGGVRATLPLVTWRVYRRGIGIKVSLMGDVFLPVEFIDALELEKGMLSTLYHHSPEVRGPVRVPNYVARFIGPMLGPHKVVVTAELVKTWNPFRLF
jgi:hypothetical protein